MCAIYVLAFVGVISCTYVCVCGYGGDAFIRNSVVSLLGLKLGSKIPPKLSTVITLSWQQENSICGYLSFYVYTISSLKSLKCLFACCCFVTCILFVYFLIRFEDLTVSQLQALHSSKYTYMLLWLMVVAKELV